MSKRTGSLTSCQVSIFQSMCLHHVLNGPVCLAPGRDGVCLSVWLLPKPTLASVIHCGYMPSQFLSFVDVCPLSLSSIDDIAQHTSLCICMCGRGGGGCGCGCG